MKDQEESSNHGESSTMEYDAAGSNASPPSIVPKRDTAAVTYSKRLVLFVILVAAISMTFATYNFTKQQEEADFEVRFKDFGRQVLDVADLNAIKMLDLFTNWSKQITIASLASNSEWPFVTPSKFEVQADSILKQTDSSFTTFSPFVKLEEQDAYQKYWNENKGWIEDGYKFSGTDFNSSETYVSPFIFHLSNRTAPASKPLRGEGFLPFSVTAPGGRSPQYINFDSLSLPIVQGIVNSMMESREPVLGAATDPSEEGTIPQSFVATPIFEDTEPGSRIAGAIFVSTSWSNYFNNLIPQGNNGITLVVRNTCNRTSMYQINGPEVEYLGNEDLHDTKFNHLEVSGPFTSFPNVKECQNTFYTYPTNEFRNDYVSNRPIIYAAIVFGIFLLTAAAFIGYDWLVERRQKKVMETAAHSDAIVSSLFPSSVRDRLVAQASSLSRNNINDEGQCVPKTFAIESSSPIADCFASASVLFADIVGFTAWASRCKSPENVFTLLETLYGSMDAIAKRRGVFKVETIGDCYLAACGLPVERKDHAPALAKFARECLSKMRSVLRDLGPSLGPATSKLDMRVGIHSGEVTAGVLRGDKSRFQLFGDTVNTAARMESTGMPGRIHVSQETAALLMESGMRSSLKRREDAVVAKGKGQLQTFWLLEKKANQASPMRSDDIHLDAEQPTPAQSESNGVIILSATGDEAGKERESENTTSQSA